jgi:hypothetical protein
MFINFTNHPSSNWSQAQLADASNYGEILDMPFPAVDPDNDESYILTLADSFVSEIMKHAPKAVLCQGEMTLAFAVTRRLTALGIPIFAATSNRSVHEATVEGKTVKRSEFRFVRFRKYEF